MKRHGIASKPTTTNGNSGAKSTRVCDFKLSSFEVVKRRFRLTFPFSFSLSSLIAGLPAVRLILPFSGRFSSLLSSQLSSSSIPSRYSGLSSLLFWCCSHEIGRRNLAKERSLGKEVIASGRTLALVSRPPEMLSKALWQLLWVNPLTQHNTGKSVSKDLSKKKPVDLIQNRVGVVVSELLSQIGTTGNNLLPRATSKRTQSMNISSLRP
ncbi:unnamed protein product [Microthlaspi erraticum]|uniref:Uncharacterized protein n=1 Tax=Microthlaspi erraticum TaxID=1685480 RepID=A0A6D2KLB5_9BRAS|nr:unnamed protein product [Microthlaspi erraticum]